MHPRSRWGMVVSMLSTWTWYKKTKLCEIKGLGTALVSVKMLYRHRAENCEMCTWRFRIALDFCKYDDANRKCTLICWHESLYHCIVACNCPNNSVPFYWHRITLILVWISNHMPSKMWDENSYPFPNFMVCTFETQTSTAALLMFANG